MLFQSGANDIATDLVLKTTPPRAPRHTLTREHLRLDAARLRDCPVLVLQAPAGFGKTCLLAQWRREALAGGAASAWLQAEAHDEPQRLLCALVQAVRAGCARPAFARQLLEAAPANDGVMDNVTALLAEIAADSLKLMLMVDDADCLPAASTRVLAYLLHNAPPNLRVVLGGRSSLQALVLDLEDYGHSLCVGPAQLRFSYEETRKLVAARLGAAVDEHASARLHDLTEGWPLGLQLTLAAMEHGGSAALADLNGSAGALRERVIGNLLARLAPADQDFLLTAALTEAQHPELCAALTGQADAPVRLARLVCETPLFVVTEGSAWCRMHALAREVLRRQLQQRDGATLRQLHLRAAHWLARYGMEQEAAQHAHAGGDQALTFALAERCLSQAVRRGELAALEQWRQLLPEEELARRPQLRLGAAWVLALGERHRQSECQVRHILAGAGDAPELRYECALISGAAALYGDDIDRFVALFAPWAAQAPPTDDAWLLQSHANRLALCALHQGDPGLARRHLLGAPAALAADSSYVRRWADFVLGYSYLWEGQMRLAWQAIAPALARADAELGRRHQLSAMFAAVAASAALELDGPAAAQSLLAHRLDVLERCGTADSLLLAYGVAARVAMAQEQEHRALDLFESLHAAGAARELPRVCAASVAEQIRLHALRGRADSARALLPRLETLAQQGGTGALARHSLELLLAQGRAYAAIAAHDWHGAAAPLAQGAAIAAMLRRGHDSLRLMALRALVRYQQGEDSEALLTEALDLAATYGLHRTVAEAHPLLAAWVARRQGGMGQRPAGALAPAPPAPAAPRAVPSMVLTPKERQVLELLANNLTNKEIALALEVGEETVKWHLKNLFGKLDAASRKHAVRRAQLLGLLEDCA